MDGILVTLKSNVKTDYEGKFVIDENEELVLIEPDSIGILLKTHVLPINQIDSEGKLQSGIVARAEVYWNGKRSPAPSLEVPEDIVWLSGTTLGGEESEEEDENEYVEEEPVDVNQASFDL